jgi:DNA-binding NtrC family response regulator
MILALVFQEDTQEMNEPKDVLVLEGDMDIAAAVSHAGMRSVPCKEPSRILQLVEGDSIAAIIIDRAAVRTDMLELVLSIRETDSGVPILVVGPYDIIDPSEIALEAQRETFVVDVHGDPGILSGLLPKILEAARREEEGNVS